MSELKSVPFAASQRQKELPAGWVNTNQVLQAALQQLSKKEREQIVLRCDDLPPVCGPEDELRRLFICLLQMLPTEKEHPLKLFLHIKCSSQEPDPIKPKGATYFSIQFNTNPAPGAHWRQTNEHRIAEAGLFLQTFSGSLSVGPEPSGGCCLFSVSLPGKFH